jgi:uridine kinase
MLTGNELEPGSELQAENIAEEILAYRRAGMKQLVVGISGRSGSGKSTVAKQVAGLLRNSARGRSASTILTTDNYHRGRNYLREKLRGPVTNWDEADVYDTKALAFDVWNLQHGEPIEHRKFSFRTQEPYVDGMIHSEDVIIIEGIHAGSPDLDKVRQLHFNLRTPLATSIGRDLERIRKTTRANDSIGSPEKRLRYQLEYAEPTFQTIESSVPKRNRWSASMRPIGAVALTGPKRTIVSDR